MTPDRMECEVLDAAERAELESAEGIIFDIQRYSLHDGPGLRTNVFFKGCSLCCEWCCNPESQRSTPELSVFRSNCIGCGDCVPVCPQEALHLEDGKVVRAAQRCNDCGQCVGACPSGALRLIGRKVTAGEVLREVLRDAPFYSQSGGGLTLTGGEPALQPSFALALLRLAKADGLHTALETCGEVPWEVLEPLLPYVELVLYDLKHMDPEQHRQATQTSNDRVLGNIRRLVQADVNVIIRVPLIPGFNADEDNLRRVAAFAHSLGIAEVHLLPYHALGKPKYRALGRDYMLEEISPMKEEQTEPAADTIRSYGLIVRVGG